jgi:hypothetical protein
MAATSSSLRRIWASFGRRPGENLADGIYSVEATPLDGPLDNGYGMIFRAEDDAQSFYIFEVSADGFVWIGYCLDACAEQAALIGDGWFPAEAVRQGLDVTNTLRVRAEAGNMIFYVNDTGGRSRHRQSVAPRRYRRARRNIRGGRGAGCV